MFDVLNLAGCALIIVGYKEITEAINRQARDIAKPDADVHRSGDRESRQRRYPRPVDISDGHHLSTTVPKLYRAVAGAPGRWSEGHIHGADFAGDVVVAESVGGAASCPGVNKVRFGCALGQHVRGQCFSPGIEGEAQSHRFAAGTVYVDRAEIRSGLRHLLHMFTVIISNEDAAGGVNRDAFGAL